ncbi:GNAT family N-acetyltransferase [Alkalibaculum sp. M08DMB]|uniref:GNAT family N-acetyltransferase n=1 Tax=Alkalibaculum sporogenes TaxID=2655001 RepID=A0A6A7KBX1_9FIRM|nr:GNAT family N-acetyltransferase [Alkalibaculum sporogenes]MPW26852.1 GNAT family N-acetyltransferase [Alkalibaculum sporogenes]
MGVIPQSFKSGEITPQLALYTIRTKTISIIGAKLLKEKLEFLNDKGYRQVSLSVEKDNYAVKMYKNFGFTVIEEKENDYLMLYRLK